MAHEQETFTGETGLVNIDSVFFKIVNEETDTPGFSKWFAPNPADEALIDQAIFDSTSVATLITATFAAHPSFGRPKDPIEFPNELRG